jgi:hypothetical protein
MPSLKMLVILHYIHRYFGIAFSPCYSDLFIRLPLLSSSKENGLLRHEVKIKAKAVIGVIKLS